MTTAPVPIETLGAEIKARIAAGDKALDKAEQHYIAAGIQLAEAKRRLEETREMRWSAFLFSHARIQRRRADDLIAIADGRITMAEHKQKNRERVAAHRERKKEEARALRNAEPAAISSTVLDTRPAEDLHAIIERQAREIDALKRKLAKAEETIVEKEAQRSAQESRANVEMKQARDAANRAMFAEADKERLAEELEALRNEAPTEAVLAWLSSAPADDEEREAFLRKLRYVISDWYVPIHWYEDCAAELHAARGTPQPEALARKNAHRAT